MVGPTNTVSMKPNSDEATNRPVGDRVAADIDGEICHDHENNASDPCTVEMSRDDKEDGSGNNAACLNQVSGSDCESGPQRRIRSCRGISYWIRPETLISAQA